MSKLLFVIVAVLSATSASLAADCPFKNMSANSRVGMFDQASNAYYMQPQATNPVGSTQPVRRQK